MISLKQQNGISVIGIIIVLIIVGALVAGLMPMLLSKHTQSVQGLDFQALGAAKTAIVSYALSKGNIPFSVGATTQCVKGTMPSGTVYPVLGVNNWGTFGKENPFCMDANVALTTTTTPSALCQAAKNLLVAPTAPYVCQDAACTVFSPVAFVLYSTGNDHLSNLKNELTNQIYESDNHGIDNSAGANHYDDQLVSYPLDGLVDACVKAGLLPPLPVCAPTATPSEITLGGSSTLVANCSNSPTSWTWTNDTASPNPTSASGSVTPLSLPTTYTVTASNASGASTSAQVTVTAVSSTAPVCTMTPATLNVQTGTTGTLTASCTNNPNYAWNITCLTTIAIVVNGIPTGQSCVFSANSLPNASGANTVTATATNAAGSDSVSATVTVSSCILGQSKVVVNNNSGSTLHYKMNGTGSCNILSTGSNEFACQNDGTYFIAIKGINGCSSDIGSTVNNPAICTVSSSLVMSCP